MRKASKHTATRQVIHVVGEILTELFYFSHLKKLLDYRYSISPTPVRKQQYRED